MRNLRPDLLASLRSLRSERRLPLRLILLLGGTALTALLFLWLWSEIAEGELNAIDREILLAFRNSADLTTMAGPTWLRQTMLDFTTLGGTTVIILMIVGSATFLYMKGAHRMALVIVGATISGSIMVTLLKGFFQRPRPTLVDHLVIEHSASYPSGHAANSAIVYLTIAVLFLRAEPSLKTRIFVLSAALLLTFAVGVSRVALGVHWPSDVLAGWMFGISWACLWALLVKLPAVEEKILPGEKE
jgi:undecaprenyl-diphosphatase